LIPYSTVRGKEVLEIGVGSGFHSELLARAGARVTGIDLTVSSIQRTRKRFELKGLGGSFESWDAEQPRDDFLGRFAFIWSWGVIDHSSRTARIVRNASHWGDTDSVFAGMVYHRHSTSALAAIVRDLVLQRNLLSHSIDEALWRGTDGFSARFYPLDQWRDLLLGFYNEATVNVEGIDTDLLPLPHPLRRRLERLIAIPTRRHLLGRVGSFLTFRGWRPLRP
jgi:SAM-dependent methyltransferase